MKNIVVGLLLVLLFACKEKNTGFVSAGFAYHDTIPKELPWVDTIHAKEKAVLIDAYFKDLHRKGFNGNVLIAQRGHIIYQNNFGFADFLRKKPLTENSIFQIASTSKQFTAISILMLIEEGKLSLDDDIRKYLPTLPYEGITIRMLLAHRSGLPNYMYFADQWCRDTCKSLSNAGLLEMMAKHKPAIYSKPDRHFYYCNTNYAVLASIVETVTGTPFNEFVKNNIFEPCGMTNSFIRNNAEFQFPTDVAPGHMPNKKPIGNTYQNGVYGDKGVYTTTGDLFKWETALFNGTVINDSLMHLAFEPQNEEKRNGHNYGFGWRICSLESCSPVVYHAGWWQGYKACLVHLTRDESSIIVLSNIASSGFHLANVEDVLKVLYGSHHTME